MKRQDKYPDTSTFKYYNANPKNRVTTDCVFRALSTGLGLPYDQVVMEMAEMCCKTGYHPGSNEGIEKYLESKGWVKQRQPRKPNNKKYTGKEFCKHIQEFTFSYPAEIIANIGGHHIVAIVFGRIFDIWDCTDKCIGNYWIKKK